MRDDVGAERAEETKEEQARSASPEQDLHDFVKAITRIEVIDEGGRRFTRWNASITLSFQDQGRTLKIFVAPEGQ